MAWSKESRHARGYGTRWDKLRLVILRRDKYLCQCPDCLGGAKRVRAASEVDHIVPKAEGKRLGWSEDQIDAETNLRAVNSDCHKRLTARQKGYKPRPQIGADGWPVT
jgi:5-methylcytosine-specific restriction protein A